MAAGSEEASSNVQTVAAASEELAASISEISQQVNQSAEIAKRAVSRAEETDKQIHSLAERADKIVDVTDFIDRKIQALLAHDSQMKLTVDMARLAFETFGSEPEALALFDRDNYGPVLDMFIRAMGKKFGDKAGCEYGEAFRYETVVDLFDVE